MELGLGVLFEFFFNLESDNNCACAKVVSFFAFFQPLPNKNISPDCVQVCLESKLVDGVQKF